MKSELKIKDVVDIINDVHKINRQMDLNFFVKYKELMAMLGDAIDRQRGKKTKETVLEQNAAKIYKELSIWLQNQDQTKFQH